MTNRIIFFNTGWMNFYRGLRNDTISGGGKYVADMGYGEEIFNFQPFKGKLYGYVQPKIDKKYKNPSTIKLEKLGALETDEKIDHVTVVWTASDPDNGGTYIVGWYEDATVYRHYQELPLGSKRFYKDRPCGFYTESKEENCTLLNKDQRNVPVLRQKKNWMGQSNVWYAENNPQFLDLVNEFIFKGKIPKSSNRNPRSKGSPKQADPLKRLAVEKRAVKIVTDHYSKLGYEVESFEKDNLGWDLSATNNKMTLKLEVKGLSGENVIAELTPNEFKNLGIDKSYHRLCIVTSALKNPVLRIFAFSSDTSEWISDDGSVLKFQELVGARVSC